MIKAHRPSRRGLYNPIIYEKTAEGEEMYDVFSRLMKERIIFISGPIEQENSDAIIAQLLWLDNQNSKKPISLYINSEGGAVSSMFALYDAMQFIKSEVYTYVIGVAQSAAAVLLAAGNRGNRVALPNSVIMIHQPWAAGIGGQVTDIEIEAKQLYRDKRKMIEILARHTGQTYEKVAADCERDNYITPQEAVAYGIVDEITPPQKQIPALITAASAAKTAAKAAKSKAAKAKKAK
jgi:ATP-dependent Clp protease protease subunit